MNGWEMYDYGPENWKPVGEHAAKLLEQVGQKPDGSGLFLVQLGLWALDEGKVKPSTPRDRERAEDLLGAASLAEPKEVMNDMLGEDFPKLFLKESDPVDAASLFLDELECVWDSKDLDPFERERRALDRIQD